MTDFLLIAPRDSRLPWLDHEIELAVNRIGADLLISQVDSATIAKRLLEKSFNVVWVCGHGGQDSVIELSTSVHLDADTFATALRGHNLTVVVVNTCASKEIAHALYASVGVPVVFSAGSIDDQSAFVMALRYIDAMANGEDYRQAFDICRGENFYIVPEHNAEPSRDILASILSEIRSLTERVAALESKRDYPAWIPIAALGGAVFALLWFVVN